MIVPDKIAEFISGLDLTSTITAMTLGAESLLTVENLYHARPGLSCFVSSKFFAETEYTILGVDYDAKTVLINGNPIITEFELPQFRMPVPNYFHGTPYATNAHIGRLSDAAKVPMIYLLEILREELQGEDSMIETVADLRLFFLDVANFQDWDTDQHYSNVIVPMRNLMDAFVEQARTSPIFGDIPVLDVITHVKFGVYQTNKGHLNSLFNDRLSGIELRGNFPFYKCCNC